MPEINHIIHHLQDPTLARFDAVAADMADYAEDPTIDMSRQVETLYYRAIETMNENPDVFIAILDFVDRDEIEQLPTQALQERAEVYRKHKEVFDELFLNHIDASLLK